MESKTKQQIEQVKKGLMHLAGVCDGAHSRDGHGFDGRDAVSQFIRDAVEWAQDLPGAKRMSYKAILILLRTCKKYHKQLTKAGLSIPDRIEELERIVSADAGGESEASPPPREESVRPAQQQTRAPVAQPPGPRFEPPAERRPAPAARPAPASPPPAPMSHGEPPDDDGAPHPADGGFYDGIADSIEHGGSGDTMLDFDEPISAGPTQRGPQSAPARAPDTRGPQQRPTAWGSEPTTGSKPGEQRTLAQAHEVEFVGTIVGIRFGPSDKGWVICTMTVQSIIGGAEQLKGYPQVTVTGTIPTAKSGGTYKVGGKWEDGKNRQTGKIYGRQIKASMVIEQIPETRGGLISWLTTIPGLGQVLAARIVDHFGVGETVQVLLDSPERIAEIPGIGVERSSEMIRKIEERGKHRELIMWLGTLGLSHTMIEKVRAHFAEKGEDPQQAITGNPYRLMEIDGIGFKKADALALNLQIPPDSPFRVAAGILHGLDTACSKQGHCYIPRDELVSASFETLRTMDGRVVQSVGRDVITKTIHSLVETERIMDEGGGVWPKSLWNAETQVASSMISRLKKPDMPAFEAEKLERWQDLTGLRLHEVQEEAVLLAMVKRVMVLTGQPGTGKTTTVRAIVDMLEQSGRRVALAAPTGKASRRLAQATSREAQTVHRLIGLSQDADGNRRPDSNYVDADTVLLDEASMVDITLLRSLVRVMHPEAQLILVGDIDQLPSVGAGRVLRDLIESGLVPLVRLTQIFRQAGGIQNQIVAAAHAINSGIVPEMGAYAGKETLLDNAILFLEIPKGDAAAAQEAICTVIYDIQEKLTDAGRDDDPFEISQVLIPQRSGAAGVKDVNTRLQREFNTSGMPIKEGHTLCTGDKVMQIKNNYDLDQGRGIFNGDVGYIVEANPRAGVLVIAYEGKPVAYTYSQADEVVPSYATTIHKCVHPDTLVETPSGLIRIADIPESGEIATPIGARSYQSKIVNPPGRMLHIRTADGYELRVTPEHGVDVWSGEKYIRKEAGYITPGDVVRLKLGATFDPQTPVTLPAPIAGKPQAQIHVVPEFMTSDVAEFLGLMVADGTLYHGGFRLAKRHKEVVDRFASLCMALFGVQPKAILLNGKTEGVEVNSTQISSWLTAVGGMSPNKKAVPGCILKSSLDIQAAFLRGLFEDGSVHLRSDVLDHIEWSNCVPDMVRVVRVMLLRFGIISGCTPGRPESLYIYGRNANRFGEIIGFISNLKRNRVQTDGGHETRYTISVSDHLIQALQECRVKATDRMVWINARARKTMSRHAMSKLMDCMNDHGQALIQDLLDYHHTTVKVVEETVAPSMCVEVPDGHRFLQDGFIGWNSQGSEYPVVIVVMHSSHYHMLNRQLLYTAVTRGKKTVVVIGDRRALEKAVSDATVAERYSMLKDRIRGGLQRRDDDLEGGDSPGLPPDRFNADAHRGRFEEPRYP